MRYTIGILLSNQGSRAIEKRLTERETEKRNRHFSTSYITMKKYLSDRNKEYCSRVKDAYRVHFTGAVRSAPQANRPTMHL